MKITIVFILSILSFTSFGQTNHYYPFPDSNAIWNMNAKIEAGICYMGTLHYNRYREEDFSYFINGDTTFLGNVYHKIYSSTVFVDYYCAAKGNSSDVYSTEPGKFIGAYRQDTTMRKVYKFDTLANHECLLYNFNINIGDSISADCNPTFMGNQVVLDIDSVLIGNSYRKRIKTNYQYIIEGIGSVRGLFGQPNPYYSFYGLVCYSQDGQNLYPDTTAQCVVVTGINELNIEHSKALIFPNPFTATTNVHLNDEFIGGVISIFNIVGTKVQEYDILQSTTLINRNNLDNGVYFLKVSSMKVKVINGKIVVQ